jgi:hypothetical protein
MLDYLLLGVSWLETARAGASFAISGNRISSRLPVLMPVFGYLLLSEHVPISIRACRMKVRCL